MQPAAHLSPIRLCDASQHDLSTARTNSIRWLSQDNTDQSNFEMNLFK
jgi:hypothetical protein